jgi:hypothetical protein
MTTGVATLDPPLVQQTKSEIRTLASEIAKLAHADIPPAEFFSGFLPRVCMAMGSEAAGIWQTERSWLQNQGITYVPPNADGPHADAPPSAWRLVSNHSLPRVLFSIDQTSCREDAPHASAAHARILQCVLTEGQPILVPPSATPLESARPRNPIDDSLIIVPVKVQDDVEYLLQVIQQPSGGPAAQRGYLRFVAQMADLMADYLRRQALREHTQRAKELQDFEYWLSLLAQAPSAKKRIQIAADAIAELLNSHQVMVLRSTSRPRVLAISDLPSFDARSESILALQSIEKTVRRSSHREQTIVTLSGSSEYPNLQETVENACELTASKRLVRTPLGENSDFVAYLAFEDLEASPAQTAKLNRVVASIPGLLSTSTSARAPGLSWILGPQANGKQPTRKQLQRLAVRLAITALGSAIAMFPVPQQISTTAVLAPVHKQVYYAPALPSPVVKEVLVEDDQFVVPGQLLLRLSDTELENETRRLTGEQQRLKNQVELLRDEVLRDTQPATQQRFQLEGKLRETESQLASILADLQMLGIQATELQIVAKQSGQVASWDIRNRLLGKPLNAGELLLSTFEPEGAWQLQISVPEYRVGLILDSLQMAEKDGLKIQYTLSSHPNQLLEGRLIKLAQQTTRRPTSDNVVLATAIVDSQALPLKKEGAIARATIECGYVPAVWLVVRDAYWACETRLKMLW